MTHTIDNLFESDSLLGDPNDLDNLLEYRDEPDPNLEDDDREEERGGGDDDEEETEKKESTDKKSDEKKVTRVKRPQPKLDHERLKGPRGLLALPKAMSDFKFRGKGYEADDLSRFLARFEHWAHRLYPKFQFDDFLEKVEKLGTKKTVQAYVKRIRLGMEESTDAQRLGDSDTEDDPNPLNPSLDESQNEFDRLLAEQVSLYQNTSVSSILATPSQTRVPVATSSAASSLTAEQKERIERNRRAAMEKRQKRLATALPPVTPPPPPISPLPVDVNLLGAEEHSNTVNPPSEELASERNHSLPDISSTEGQSSSSDSTNSSSTPSAAALKMVADVLNSEKENLVPEPAMSTRQGERIFPRATLDTSLDAEPNNSKSSVDDSEVSHSPVQESLLKRTVQRDGGESSHHGKRFKKDVHGKDPDDSGDDSAGLSEGGANLEEDPANFEEDLEKMSQDGTDNDNEGSSCGSGNKN